jgi:diacylglycerol kinase (ATP)
MPLRRWIDSANNAIEGILHASKTQRHVRYHLYAASTVVIVSYLLGVSRLEFLFIAVVATMVILAEMINSAIESVVDLISPQRHEKARIAKDIAAGAVFITAFSSIVIGYIILIPYIKNMFEKGLRIAKHTDEETAIVALVIVSILVVITKARFGKGHPLRGGLPSGHAALSFSIWMSVSFISENFIVSALTFVIALMIAQSRVAIKIHTPWEVILGALLGIVVTFPLFLIFT